MKKVLSILLIAVMCLTLVPSTASAAVTLNKATLVLNINKSSTLKLSGNPANTKWTSSNKKIATVTNTGKVHGVSDGQTTVTASVNSKKYKCSVFVGKTVDIVLPAIIFDDSISIDEYLETAMNENDDFISVKKYDDSYYTATILESNRKNTVDKATSTMDESMDEMINNKDYIGAFTSIKCNNDLSDIQVYADVEKYNELGFGDYGLIVGLMYFSNYYQAYNLVDTDKRVCVITIYDNITNEVLYSSKE